MKRILIFIVVILVVILTLLSCKKGNPDSETLNVRLQWYPHAQFAGYIVALKKGFYDAEDLEVNLHSAGPDIKPTTAVASGSDHIGIGVPNQIITARANKVPLTIIAQIFQDSPNRYVLKSENRIDSLQELSGKKIGLWLGGDEAEFISMLSSVGMKLTDVQVIPQEFSVTPFLEDQYILSQVTTYNELIQIRNQGYEESKLQILSPKNYNSAILGDVIFSKEELIQNKQEALVKFLRASIKGWQYTIDNPDEALKIVLDYNPELEENLQRQTLNAIIELVSTEQSQVEGIGYMNPDEYENIQRILLQSGQITEGVDISKVYSNEVWNQIKLEEKLLQ
jgi:NitT/TauT family transport system substrate-binding protein